MVYVYSHAQGKMAKESESNPEKNWERERDREAESYLFEMVICH